MTETAFAVLMILVLAWAVASHLLASVNITGALVFLVAGYALANPSWGPLAVDVETPSMHLLAELTLALLLFSDAARVNLSELKRDIAVPARLLGIGLPLSLVLGSLLAAWMFDDFSWAIAGFVGATLAPTDAALSAQVINDERIPMRLRRELNVESGLNDGIATPIVVFTLAVAASQLGVAGHDTSAEGRALLELAVGVLVGVTVGLGSAILIAFGSRRQWVVAGGRRLATLAAALASFSVAVALDGNGFIAAFVAGLAFGSRLPADVVPADEVAELPELAGRALGARRLVPLRRRARARRARQLLRVHPGVRLAQSDGDPDAPGRAVPSRHGAGQVHRPVRRVVRTAGAGLGRVRAPGRQRSSATLRWPSGPSPWSP